MGERDLYTILYGKTGEPAKSAHRAYSVFNKLLVFNIWTESDSDPRLQNIPFISNYGSEIEAAPRFAPIPIGWRNWVGIPCRAVGWPTEETAWRCGTCLLRLREHAPNYTWTPGFQFAVGVFSRWSITSKVIGSLRGSSFNPGGTALKRSGPDSACSARAAAKPSVRPEAATRCADFANSRVNPALVTACSDSI